MVDNTTTKFRWTRLSIAPSRRDGHVIRVRTDGGTVQVTRNGDRRWSTMVREVPRIPSLLNLGAQMGWWAPWDVACTG
jgi:hypothetical protein